MKILSASQIREADQYTIEHEPISSIDLMERASTAFCNWYEIAFPTDKKVIVFCGMGNNGGDGLAIARILARDGYQVAVFVVKYKQEGSEDFQVNLERLEREIPIEFITNDSEFPDLGKGEVLIDALWGSGLTRSIEGFPALLIENLNAADSIRVAVDIPSGLFADRHGDSIKFKASYTFAFEAPKFSFMLGENHPFVGEWIHAGIGLHPAFILEQECANYLITLEMAKELLRDRRKFDHKGNYGHALLIAGSHGKIGAAILSARASLRSGAGLVTVYLPSCGYSAIQAAFPESMVIVDPNELHLSKAPELEGYSAVGIGPGLGTHKDTVVALQEVLGNVSVPFVLDADALNIVAKNPGWMERIPKGSVLTPHPKEFERMFGTSKNQYARHELLTKAAKELKSFIVLKGGHTAISCPDGSTYFNSTGNPGMATAGSGDVLTGVLTGLLAQGYPTKEACLLGVFIHGLAADLCANTQGYEALTASDIIEYLGPAYRLLSSNKYPNLGA